MPRHKKSDNPDALTEAVVAMVTRSEHERIKRLAKALGTSKSGAVRFLIRAGFDTPTVKSFTPQEKDQS